MGKLYTIILSVLLSCLFISSVYAAQPGGATITNSGSVGFFPTPTGDSVDLQSGVIYSANLSTEQATFRWVGLFGNVSGTIILGDADADIFYSWNAKGNLVYASDEANPDWTSVSDASLGDVISSYPYLNQGSDNYNVTFVGVSESIGSQIFSVSSDYATTYTGLSTTWKTYSLKDGADIIFVGKIVEDGVAYDGSVADFQMIIPEDGVNGDASLTTYNLWVELI